MVARLVRVFIYYGHPSIGQLATDAPFIVVTDGGSQAVRVNYNDGVGIGISWAPSGIPERSA